MIDEQPEVVERGPVEDQRVDAKGRPLPNRRSLPDRRVNPARLHLKSRKTMRRKSDRDIMEFINKD